MKVNSVSCDAATQLAHEGKGRIAVTNPDANTGYIYIGDSRVSSTNYFIRLVPGDVYEFEHESKLIIWLINSVTGETARQSIWL